MDPPWRGRDLGIPVKDYIAQSSVFLLCTLGLLEGAFVLWQKARQCTAVGLLLLSALFLINILLVERSRTALVVIPILLLVFGARRLGTIGVAGALVAVITLATLAWQTSASIGHRVTMVVQEAREYQSGGARTSGGERLEFWRRSIMSITEAPLLGHGTGSIPEQFRRSATGQTGLGAQAPHNPHNQVFAVAIELGLIGPLFSLQCGLHTCVCLLEQACQQPSDLFWLCRTSSAHCSIPIYSISRTAGFMCGELA